MEETTGKLFLTEFTRFKDQASMLQEIHSPLLHAVSVRYLLYMIKESGIHTLDAVLLYLGPLKLNEHPGQMWARR